MYILIFLQKKIFIDTFSPLCFQILQECFESQDIGKLQEAIGSLPVEEARRHMKR